MTPAAGQRDALAPAGRRRAAARGCGGVSRDVPSETAGRGAPRARPLRRGRRRGVTRRASVRAHRRPDPAVSAPTCRSRRWSAASQRRARPREHDRASAHPRAQHGIRSCRSPSSRPICPAPRRGARPRRRPRRRGSGRRPHRFAVGGIQPRPTSRSWRVFSMAFPRSDVAAPRRSRRRQAPAGDAAPVAPITVKIVVAGGFAVGKTTFIGSISDIEPLSTEAAMTEHSRRRRRRRRRVRPQDHDHRRDGLRPHRAAGRPVALPVRHARARTASTSCGTT